MWLAKLLIMVDAASSTRYLAKVFRGHIGKGHLERCQGTYTRFWRGKLEAFETRGRGNRS